MFSISAFSAWSQSSASKPLSVSGSVVETTNAANYTYVLIDTGKGKVWAAAPQAKVKVGDKVSFTDGMLMKKYQSKTLNRTFDEIYFVGSLGGTGDGLPAGHPPIGGAAPDPHAGVLAGAHAGVQGHGSGTKAAVQDFSGIKKAEKGHTVAEIYKQKDKLAKKPVVFRGKVVKFNSQILNKNWMHVQDGTGAPGSNDLTVTTQDTAQVGDTVLVTGTLVLNKDFGSGYKYDLLVEEAKVAVEKKAGK